jgi:protein-tyrosine phosphatase
MSNKKDKKAIATMVCTKIWIGNERAAKSKELFEKHQIGAVLNCTPGLPNHFSSRQDVEYMKIPVHDSSGKRDVDVMLSYFPAASEFINKAVSLDGRSVLVHCRMGRQRSAAAVAAYLIKFCDMTPAEAVAFLLERKPDVFHYGKSINFARSLNRWHQQITARRW